MSFPNTESLIHFCSFPIRASFRAFPMAVQSTISGGPAIPEELMKLLSSLAKKWGDSIDNGNMTITHLSGALTNNVYRVNWPTNITDRSRTVLVRVYGEGLDHFFDRADEIQTFESLSGLSYGPELYRQSPLGRVEEYIHARTLTANDLRAPEISKLIAAEMRRFHVLEIPGPKEVGLWKRMRKWVHEAKSLVKSEETESASKTELLDLDALEKEIDWLEKAISNSSQEIGFCHNDLQYGNIMIHDDAKVIRIIDYEYASYNPVAYDIANHFCEMAADYHSDMPHILDYNKYPGPEERKTFIQQYLESADEESNCAAVEQLAEVVEKYTLASHIFWGLWGQISAYVNHIDFDYREYSRQRYHQYWSRKSQILSVKFADSTDDS